MSDKAVLLLISSVVMFIALANLVRLLWDIPVTIGTVGIPGWTGGIVFILFGLLAAWAFKATFKLSKPEL